MVKSEAAGKLHVVIGAADGTLGIPARRVEARFELGGEMLDDHPIGRQRQVGPVLFDSGDGKQDRGGAVNRREIGGREFLPDHGLGACIRSQWAVQPGILPNRRVAP